MDRRRFLLTALAGALAAPLGMATAQPPQKMPRVGYLNPGSSSDPLRQRRLEALRQGLRELAMWKGRTSLSSPDGPRATMIGTPPSRPT